MNGPQDMGGFQGFGAVQAEANEPVFHENWEPRAFALVLAMGMTGSWNIDQARKYRELLPPVKYWSSSYYEYRFYALENQITDLGLATPDEVKSGRMSVPAKPVKRVATAAMVPDILAHGGPTERVASRVQGFAREETIRTRVMSPSSHTRLPRYAMGRRGEVVAVHGCHVFPDSNARGQGEDPQWLYTVRFTAKELWGKDTKDSVCIDLWEPYLEAC
jgi:nitrile hydratase subunit beta